MRQELSHDADALGRGPSHSSQPTLPAWFLFALMALMLASSLGFLWLGRSLAPGADLPEDELRILDRVFDRIDQQYLYPLDEERKRLLIHRAIAGMVDDLDDYSSYMPPAQHETYNRETKGVLTGIGVMLTNTEKGPRILYPLAGGPAEAAGVQVGDLIRAVDGEEVRSDKEAIAKVGGKAGTKVRMTLENQAGARREVEVTRGRVRIPATRWERLVDREHGLGYVYLSRFSERAVEDLEGSIALLETALEGPLKGLILDLRGNPGGLLKPALKLCNRFIPEGTLLQVRARGKQPVIHKADPAECRWPELPLVVLIDGDSASASEVVAGALQDYQRARLVGSRSYGKGVVNSVFSWPGRKERLKLTTAYYVTPKGRQIESHLRPDPERGEGGIEPDAAIAIPDRRSRNLMLALLKLRQAPPAYREALAALAAADPEIRVRKPMDESEDPQLRAAIEELRALILGSEMPGHQEHRPPRPGEEKKR